MDLSSSESLLAKLAQGIRVFRHLNLTVAVLENADFAYADLRGAVWPIWPARTIYNGKRGHI
jgi:uncharacterized protein YjbI with pentapeptide repeats